MELSEETFHEIHQYLSGSGTPEERLAFERRMHADPDLADEVTSQRRIRNGLKANEYKKVFRDIHAQLQNEGALPGNVRDDQVKTVPLVSGRAANAARWPYLAAAASVLIAIGVVWYFNQSTVVAPVASDTPTIPAAKDTAVPAQHQVPGDTAGNDAPAEKLRTQEPATMNADAFFARYFNPDAVLESPFSKDKLGLSPSALAQWRSDTAHVRQGIRYLASRQAQQALQAFNHAETGRFPQLKGVAAWYQALAYLQQNDLKNCRSQLKKVIADPENSYRKQAQELLSKIQ